MTLSEFITDIVRTSNNAATRAEALAYADQAHYELMARHGNHLLPVSKLNLAMGGDLEFLVTGDKFCHECTGVSCSANGSTITNLQFETTQASFWGGDVQVWVKFVPPGGTITLTMSRKDSAGNAISSLNLTIAPIRKGFAGRKVDCAYSVFTKHPIAIDSSVSANRAEVVWVTLTDDGESSQIALDVRQHPKMLSAESSAVQIPEMLWMGAWKSLIMSRIEAKELGNSTYWAQQHQADLPNFIAAMGQGLKSLDHIVPARIYG